MKSILKIYWRYVWTACVLVGFLVFINLVVWISFSFKNILWERANHPVQGPIRMEHYRSVAEALKEEADGFRMAPEGLQRMEESGCAFAMLLDSAGCVVWEWQKPEELALKYSAGDIAAFSKWYLKGYPVGVWRYGEGGLLVFGYPKGSMVRYHTYVLQEDLDAAFRYVGVFFLSNVALVFALALLFGYRFYRSLKPIGKGIDALAKGQSVRLRENGMTQYLKEKINQTSALLEKQKKELAQRDRARTEWIAGVSHDIRTPLSLIVGYADELETDTALPPAVRQRAGNIREQSFAVKKLIEDLNLTSKLTYQAQPLRRETYIPAVWLRETAARMINSGEIPENAALDLDVEAALERTELVGDVPLLTRALQNLLANSVRHNPGGCHIRLQAQTTEEGFCFCVADDGKGIPGTVQQIVKRSGTGAGEAGQNAGENAGENRAAASDQRPHVMGLLVVKQIAAAHGGRLWFAEEGRQVWVSVKGL